MLKWVFGADTSPFRRGLQQMRNETKAFSGSIKGMIAGALGLGALTNLFRALFVEMDRVQKLGIRFGETAETIQKVDLAAKLAGSGIETVAKALTVATRNAYEAATGNKEYAESFQRLGIDAAEFVNLPMEEKLAALAGAYERTEGSGAKLAGMMEVLGRSGGELIPLLAQGQEKLQAQFDGTATATQNQVDSIARFNDELTKLKQTGQVVGAFFVDSFRLVFGTIGAGLGMLVGMFMSSFEVIKEGVQNITAGLNALANRDFKGAAEAVGRMKSSFKDAFDETKANASATGEAVKELFNEIYNQPSGGAAGAGPDVEDAIAKAEEAKRIEEERAKLAAEVASMEEDARKRQLSLTEQILEAERERARLAEVAANADDATTALEARKAMLEVEKDLEGLRAKQSSEQQKSDDMRAKKAQELEDLLSREKEIERDNRLAGMSDEEKLSALRKERDAFNAEASKRTASGDQKGAAESRIKAKELTGQIDDLRRSITADAQSRLDSLNNTGPVIATSSLAEIGGGGGAALFGTETREQRKVDLLAEIAANTRAGDRPPGTPIEPSA